MQMKIRVSERSLLVEDEKAGRFTLVLDTPGAPISDFSPLANTYFKTGGSQNFGSYSQPGVRRPARPVRPASSTRPSGALMLDQMQDMLDQDPPWLFIGYTDHLLMWRSNVKGLALDKRVVSEWGRVETAWLAPRSTVRPERQSGQMQRYLLRRLLTAIPTLFGISVLVFVAMRVIPGDPLAQIANEGQGAVPLTDEELAAARASLGLDQPLPQQYLSWMGDVAHGDLGHSFWNTEPISTIVVRRGAISLEIAAAGRRAVVGARRAGRHPQRDAPQHLGGPHRAAGV